MKSGDKGAFGLCGLLWSADFPLGGDGLQGVAQLGQDRPYQAKLFVVQLTRDGHRQGVYRGGQGQGVAVGIHHIYHQLQTMREAAGGCFLFPL